MKVHQRSGFAGAVKYTVLAAWVVASLAGLVAPSVWAKEAALTPDVVGFKPVADNVAIDNQTPTLGDTLSVTYDYDDEDGDAEAAPDIKWLYNGRYVTGETGSSYTPVLEVREHVEGRSCRDFDVKVEITPKSLTGDPLVGDAKQSNPVTVSLDFPIIPGFTFPEVTMRNWNDAEAYCQAQGMALPTTAQLLSVFNTYTSGGHQLEMSQKYGWPLSFACGGGQGSSYYWTSDAYTGSVGNDRYDRYHVVDMGSGRVDFDTYLSRRLVTCTTNFSSSGHPPVASAVSFNAPEANSDVTATWIYSDADGDKESGTTVEWLVDGAVVGTGNPWKVVGSHTPKDLSVRITPKAATGSPGSTQTGAPVTSSAQAITPALIGAFIKPDTTIMPWSQADAYCKGLTPAARLPTRIELQDLFLSNTSTTGSVKYEMCDVFGWPLNGGRCGGSGNYYWTSESGNSDAHWVANMNNGITNNIGVDADSFHVACVR
ncbi:hypothetical protein [Aeromonas hydrophila]|uniref:hypothetical protein n=1 Tax=Aeromonas hydrophila TaxID=644 RepID=UPI003EC7EA30